ncbi:hypothetical protein SAMN05444392_102250 [Seinonella peptonophila]|uniref:XRE family transcriptional regulator n=1 Tax=Seinonella peptonophila TaxID=112248 RepID=A0A1M4V9W4_9BACL|nr:hypothetical protein [Seinonella peptonophila]SHE65667.1 hypothetical protein SAMN05444392_102250 [Seinonella peptonophila]
MENKLIPRFMELLDDIEREQGRKIQQKDIVNHFGWDRKRVSAWFVGRNFIPYPEAWYLSKFLKCSMHDFYREEGE